LGSGFGFVVLSYFFVWKAQPLCLSLGEFVDKLALESSVAKAVLVLPLNSIPDVRWRPCRHIPAGRSASAASHQ
jgi:hypothetical protein